jgi:hypothetical protein
MCWITAAGACIASNVNNPGRQWFRKPAARLLAGFLLAAGLWLQGCQPLSNRSPQLTTAESSVPGGSEPAVTRTPEKTRAAYLALQASALLPDFADDVHLLAEAPHYQLQVQVDPSTAAFQGSLQLQYINQESVPLDQLFLRMYPNDGASYGAGSLRVMDATLNGQPAALAQPSADSILQIDLPAPLQPGESTVLAMNFQGQVPRDFAGEEHGAYGIFNLTQQSMVLSAWYPILAVYDDSGWNLDLVNPVGDAVYGDMATYQVQVELPAAYTLAATGVQVESQPLGENALYTLVSGPAREFTLAASPRFGVVSETVDGVRVNAYYLDEATSAGKRILQVALDSLKTFNHQFGPYPYAELDIVQAELRYAGGVEFPGIVFIEAIRFEDGNNPVTPITVAHEVAHQWWYNLVGNDVVDEPWLDEALATYSSLVYWETIKGEAAYNQVVANFQESYDQALLDGVSGQITQGMEFYGLPEHASAYGAVVYTKGGLFFHALRQEVGDQAFFSALQDYFQQQRYGIATRADLLAAFESAAGRDLDRLYQEWLFGDE